MHRDDPDPTFRMRREQLGELVNLTSQMPAQPRTAEMPAVELVDLLRRDRELSEADAVSTEHFDAIVRPEGDDFDDFDDEADPAPQLAAGTVRIARPSYLRLALGCLAAFASGFAMTVPLWW
ncbi:MAG TPA: hypothetical protein VNO30_32785 [Kofleriaceae bacterium]|nr:hypothetical protein [Kofleriaceae bacterium]